MLRIIGYREYWDKAKGKMEVAERFWEAGWKASSHQELFANLQNILKTIPEHERYDLHYTVHHIFNRRPDYHKSSVVTFDVDKIEGYREEMAETVGRLFCEFFHLVYEKTAVVSSGNGVHIIVSLPAENHILDLKSHAEMYIHYKRTCESLQKFLWGRGFPGCKVDPMVWTKAATLRLPGTRNILGKTHPTDCRLIQSALIPQHLDLTKFSGAEEIPTSHAVSFDSLKKFPTPDKKAVLAGCKFLQQCKDAPASISEPEWYAMLSIVGRLDKNPVENIKLAHEMSKGHPKYDEAETTSKLEHALSAGPRTCRGIDSVWINSKCRECPYWGKITSPILIQSEEHIASQDSGFWIYKWNEKLGKSTPEKPDYEGLRKYFEREHEYISTSDSETTFLWDGKIWEEITKTSIQNYALEHFDPQPSNSQRTEFYNLIAQSNIKKQDWFNANNMRKMNFQNGVLDIETGVFSPHSSEFGFRKILPYEYNPEATAPKFDKFMDEICLGRQELKQVLLEFAGYSLSGDRCWEQKAIMLVGEGQNGKSKFVEVLRALAGYENVSALSLADLDKETFRHQLETSLFNIAEETPKQGFLDSSMFKNLVGGGEVIVKQLYKQPYSMKNKSKFWFLCNELPKTYDLTHGMFRRLVIVPFDAKFTGEKEDKNIEQKLFSELPGILNMCLSAYREMLHRQSLYRSEIVAQKLQDYKEEVDHVRRWFKDNVEVLPEINGKFLPSLKLYGTYKYDLEQENERVLTSAQFFKRLAKIVPEYEKRQDRIREEGKQIRIIRGLLLHDGSVF